MNNKKIKSLKFFRWIIIISAFFLAFIAINESSILLMIFAYLLILVGLSLPFFEN